MFLQIKGKGNYLLVFGGEVDPSSKGHEGAGGFANDEILIDEDSLKVEVMSHARRRNITSTRCDGNIR